MKRKIKRICFPLLILILTSIRISSPGQTGPGISTRTPLRDSVNFSDYFISKTLRIDFIMAGNHSTEKVFLSGIRQEPYYGGPQKNLLDPYHTGSFRISLRDSLSGKTLFTKGFCNLFQEWQSTGESKIVDRAFTQSALMPYPRRTVLFTIEKREFETGMFTSLYSMYINPLDYFTRRENPVNYPYVMFRTSGDPVNKIDIAFISEGYTEKEMPKFLSDAERIGNYFLSVKPFSDFSDRFNFYAVKAPSKESGIDIPGDRKYVNTNMNSSFYTFDTERYLTTFDAWSVSDIAANVPYDAIVILVNSSKYGGGGFYNWYAETTVDHPSSNIVAIHEFGHSFAGLADEYVGNMNFSDYYNIHIEPWEPNITTNIDFASKWKSMIPSGTPVPTPREEQYFDVVGMFEGGGYMEKNIYSPMMDCRMSSNEASGFCPVCQAAIIRMIRFYSEE